MTRIATGAGIALLLCLAVAQNVSATTTKNYSIFFMNGSTAVTGTLKGGIFTQKHLLTLNRHWDLAAASRTSLLLYNKSSGLTQTGTFVNGTYTKLHSYTLPTGYPLMTASCDTFLMWRPSDGRAITATLTKGALGTRHTSSLPNYFGFNDAAASCDSFITSLDVPNQSAFGYGTLKGGVDTTIGSEGTSQNDNQIVAMTDGAYLLYHQTVAGYEAVTGTVKAGVLTPMSNVTGFSKFDMVAATADTVLFYDSTTGSEARATLGQGRYSYAGGGTNFSTGWKVIVGAK
jgi:hypothetical protein